jgi:hypothetical protein
VPTGSGADIYFDPKVDANYVSGLFPYPLRPGAELAHELLGRAVAIEMGEAHGLPDNSTRHISDDTAVRRANSAFIRMDMSPRTDY